MAAPNIDAYIATYPPETRKILEKIRSTIASAAPEAEEAMGYGVPAFKQKQILVYFAAHKKHIGFYPTPSAIEHFKDKLGPYPLSKGTLKFPFDKPIPYDLIRDIVLFRLEELNRN